MSMKSTPHEAELVEKLKLKLTDINKISSGHYSSENVDSILLRFLRARDHNLSRAEDMLRKHLNWREMNKMDEIMTWLPPPLLPSEYPFEICGKDKEGCPILVVPFGRWDVRAICEKSMRPDYVRYVDQLFAKVIAAMNKSQEEGKTITQFVGIFLPDGLAAFRQMSSVQAVDTVLETVRRFETNYPETLKAAFIIDTPRVFQTIFSVIRPLLNSKTLGKVTIASNLREWYIPLHEIVSSDQLPPRFGGTKLSNIPLLNERIQTPTLESCKEDVLALGSEFMGLTVGAGQRLTVEYEVPRPKTLLNWAFKTDKCDIGFSLLFQGTKAIVPFSRMDAHRCIQSGQIACKESGKYVLLFDNTFSRWRSKVVRYKVTLAEHDIGNNDSADSDEEEFRRLAEEPLAFQYLDNCRMESVSL